MSEAYSQEALLRKVQTWKCVLSMLRSGCIGRAPCTVLKVRPELRNPDHKCCVQIFGGWVLTLIVAGFVAAGVCAFGVFTPNKFAPASWT